MSLSIGIAGAGLMGRVLAEELGQRGCSVTLADPDTRAGDASCGHTGAGMLAPYCELEHAEPLVSALGCRSLERWPTILARLTERVFFQQAGSLVVAHPTDRRELDRLEMLVRQAELPAGVMDVIGGQALGELEPELAGRFGHGLWFPREGQVDNLGLMAGLGATLTARGVSWLAGTRVTSLAPGELICEGERLRFDWVVDCRGLWAREALPQLRGVRGEVIRLHAPEVNLTRPVRLMHPRYPIYIVPRPNGRYVIGATSIESDDMSPASVRSVLELLSAAYTVHPGFAEGRVESMWVNCRPAFADNLPRVSGERGLVRVNGLYRHGFLLSPALAEAVADFMTGQAPSGAAATLLQEMKA